MPVIYLDNAASTRPDDEVLDLAARVAREEFGNPSSAHAAGASATRLLAQARDELAQALGAETADAVIFTSGGTEANALGVLGAAARSRGRHIVVSAIEHPAVLRNAERLVAQNGFEMTVVPPDRSGVVRPEAIGNALRTDTALVAVMLVNNELGTIEPVADIARAISGRSQGAAGQRAPHFHVDAVQALGLVPFRVSTLGADSVAVSAHKIHGLKGVGALWVRPGARVAALWEGGGQERALRSGSENLPGVMAFARAAALAIRARSEAVDEGQGNGEGRGAVARVAALRDQLETRICASVADATMTIAAETPRAPHISSLSFPGLPAEPLLHALEARGVIASAGSACASKSRGPSHVLKAIGLDDDTAVLRFSLSRHTTAMEIEAASDAVAACVLEIAATIRPTGRTTRAERIRGARRPDQI